MVVSEDPTSLVPERTEDRHMKKPWRERDFHTGVVLGPSCSALSHWSSPTQVVLIATTCLTGWLIDRLSWMTVKAQGCFP